MLAAGLLTVVMLVALALSDLAKIASARSEAQMAADAAALAAAQDLAYPTTDSDPSIMAAEYAQANGASVVTCGCAPGAETATVTVARATPPLAILSQPGGIRATAVAAVTLPEVPPPEPAGVP